MNPLFQAGLEIQQFIQEKKWRFCFIGGLAVIRWGEVRVTPDVGLSLLSGFEDEEIYVDSLLSRFKSRISNAKEFALMNRVLLLLGSNDVAVDVSLGGFRLNKRWLIEQPRFLTHPNAR